MENWDLSTEVLNVIIAIVSFITGFITRRKTSK